MDMTALPSSHLSSSKLSPATFKMPPLARRAAALRPAPKSPLLELPTELLHFICQAVLEYGRHGIRFPDHPRDLIRLGQTCKRMYPVAQSVLYRKIVAGRTQDNRGLRVNFRALVCRSRHFIPQDARPSIRHGKLMIHSILDPHSVEKPSPRPLDPAHFPGSLCVSRCFHPGWICGPDNLGF